MDLPESPVPDPAAGGREPDVTDYWHELNVLLGPAETMAVRRKRDVPATPVDDGAGRLHWPTQPSVPPSATAVRTEIPFEMEVGEATVALTVATCTCSAASGPADTAALGRRPRDRHQDVTGRGPIRAGHRGRHKRVDRHTRAPGALRSGRAEPAGGCWGRPQGGAKLDAGGAGLPGW